MGIPWRVRMWESDIAQWGAIGGRMESYFYRTDMRGNLLSGGLWVPERVRAMDSFGVVIAEDEALRWIGESGGELPHVAHPHGTLINLPRSEEVRAGETIGVDADAVFEEAPYELTLGAEHPAWVGLPSASPRIRIHPGASVVPGIYTFPTVVTDANLETSEATWTITVTPAASD